ncbi:MAG: SDR family NAD(P)-dependent oxidoreductase [Acidimicrobiaceae bacterium]|nr:SDR family NAD(P)-dependent oxidoreductase [Acidimicrobiaceae bacterium]
MAFSTTTDEVMSGIDLTGRVAVVTGATTGLGLETARALAAGGAEVVLCGRTTEKCEAAAEGLSESVSDARLSTAVFDLADLPTVRAGAAHILAQHPVIHMLVNNAGVMFTPEGRTAQGFETQFGTNHLGHFVLTNHLLDALRAGAPARVVNLSSAGHHSGQIRWDDLHFEAEPYDKFEAYGQSKTANILFSVELDRRLAGAGVRANAVHPGMIMTDLARHMTADDLTELRRRAAARAASGAGPGLGDFKSVQQGAATSVWAAVSAEMADVGGAYCEDATVSVAADYATDADYAARLWSVSEQLVGETFLSN